MTLLALILLEAPLCWRASLQPRYTAPMCPVVARYTSCIVLAGSTCALNNCLPRRELDLLLDCFVLLDKSRPPELLRASTIPFVWVAGLRCHGLEQSSARPWPNAETPQRVRVLLELAQQSPEFVAKPKVGACLTSLSFLDLSESRSSRPVRYW